MVNNEYIATVDDNNNVHLTDTPIVRWIDRYIKRGNQENFVTMLENNYETFVNDLMSDPNNKIVLDSGQYLKDVV